MARDGAFAGRRRFVAVLMSMVGAITISAPAAAHDHWINHDFPWCCGEEDCAPMSAGEVREVSGGYLIVQTGEVVPESQALPSGDGRYWRCRYLRGALEGKTRCFFRALPAV